MALLHGHAIMSNCPCYNNIIAWSCNNVHAIMKLLHDCAIITLLHDHEIMTLLHDHAIRTLLHGPYCMTM